MQDFLAFLSKRSLCEKKTNENQQTVLKTKGNGTP